MIALDTIVGEVGDRGLTAGGLLEWLRARGQLGPLVREALVARLVREEARGAGLSVAVEELQAAADAFRRRRGLDGADATHRWLAEQGMSVDDFEAMLEDDLLGPRLKQHLTDGRVEEYFSAHRTVLEQVLLTTVFAGRDDLAAELASQVRDEGRDLGEAAREHGLTAIERWRSLGELGGALEWAVAGAAVGDLVGPVETPRGLALVVVHERRAAELTPDLRRRIQDTLFAEWMSARLVGATVLGPPSGSGG
jgi:hypothetical protein